MQITPQIASAILPILQRHAAEQLEGIRPAGTAWRM